MLTRQTLVKNLVKSLEKKPYIVACWEGGSAATGRLDEYSDLDLVTCAEANSTEKAMEDMSLALSQLSEIEYSCRIPEPSWHGHSQCFFKISGINENFFIDFVVMSKNTCNKFIEPERHGKPVIYFDKSGFIDSKSANTDAFTDSKEKRFQHLKSFFPFIKIAVTKELKRNKPLDALAFYRRSVDMLIEIMGMNYRPYRYDFGMRYLHKDFPADIIKTLENLCYVAHPQQIKTNLEQIDKLFQNYVQKLETH